MVRMPSRRGGGRLGGASEGSARGPEGSGARCPEDLARRLDHGPQNAASMSAVHLRARGP
eukprot:6548501-Pyramimonas_sp.AAC.1